MPSTANGIVADNSSSHDWASTTSSSASFQQLCGDIHRRVTSFLETATTSEELRRVQEQTRISLQVTEEALNRYTPQHLSLSYNGGKDCLVLLVLYLAAIHTYYGSEIAQGKPFPESLETVYIQAPHSFPEVDAFVRQTSTQYRLRLSLSKLPMKAAFAEYLNQNPHIQAIFVGTRRTDPHGSGLTHFDETDRGWPKFMRIHPVVDWHYREIWTFIRHLEIPYCPLYDLGYTSLGGTTDSYPNPALKSTPSAAAGGGAAEVAYRPAYELVEDREERLGRDR